MSCYVPIVPPLDVIDPQTRRNSLMALNNPKSQGEATPAFASKAKCLEMLCTTDVRHLVIRNPLALCYIPHMSGGESFKFHRHENH